MSVPKLRFRGFTEEWEKKKLGEITKRVKGNDGRMNLPTLTISAKNGWMRQEDRFSSNIAGAEQKNYTLLSKGELSYNHGNSKLAKYGVVYSLKHINEALVPKVYHSFKTTKFFYNLFIEYLFMSKIPDRELRKLISSGARMDGLLNIGYDEFMGINVILPEFEEQQKIGDFFMLLDKRIEQQEQKIALLKDYKKAMMQKIFSQKIRFKDENGNDYPDWEEKKLGEMFEIKKGIQISKKDLSLNGQKCILYGELFTRYDEIIENVTSKTNLDILPNSKYHDILMPSSDVTPNGLAKASCLLENDIILGGDINILRYKNENVFPPFFSYQLNYFKKKIMDVVSGTTIKHVYSKNIEKLNYKLPLCIDEQEKITSFLLAIENNIKTQKEMVETLKKEKISLLNKMFV